MTDRLSDERKAEIRRWLDTPMALSDAVTVADAPTFDDIRALLDEIVALREREEAAEQERLHYMQMAAADSGKLSDALELCRKLEAALKSAADGCDDIATDAYIMGKAKTREQLRELSSEAREALACQSEAGQGKRPAEAIKDEAAVDRFADAMKEKLARARIKGRGGWDDKDDCPAEHLADMLIEHVRKGNDGSCEDIANLSMFLHQRGESPAVVARAMLDFDKRRFDAGWNAREKAEELFGPFRDSEQVASPTRPDVEEALAGWQEIRDYLNTPHAQMDPGLWAKYMMIMDQVKRAIRASRGVPEWRRIESAPEGERVLLKSGLNNPPVVGMAHHHDDGTLCTVLHYNGDVLVGAFRATHWRCIAEAAGEGTNAQAD